jgi:pimeloyl-ACP methyl ester carboxylesterase
MSPSDATVAATGGRLTKTEFEEFRIDVDGTEIAVLSAGEGEPLVFFHGAGTAAAFDALLPLAARFRLLVPYHPGYGPSADDTTIDSIWDFIRHHLNLLDELGIEELALAGHSMGGYMAAVFAATQNRRVRRLALCAPIGLHVREHPVVDIFSVPDEELFSMLAEDPSVFAGRLATPPTPEFLADRYRESTSTARVFWNRSYDTKLPKWLHRLTMPTLLLWGEKDKLIPVEQAPIWAEHIGGTARVEIVPGVGHLLFDESPEPVRALAEFVGEELRV